MARFSDPNLPIRILDQHNKIVKRATSKEAAQRFTRNVYAGLSAGFYARTDARARTKPLSYHHLYEWGQVGDGGARLFRLISRNIGKESFEISYEFIPSTAPVPNSGHIFAEKARVMEEGQQITITPKDGGMLSFEVDGEQIYTINPVVVPHPGGEAVKGTLRDDFMMYFRPSVLVKNPAYQSAVNKEKEAVMRLLKRGVG